MKFFVLLLCLFQFSLATAQTARQRTGFLFDGDDNLFGLKTKIILFHADGREVPISTYDFSLFRSKLGQEGEVEINGIKYQLRDLRLVDSEVSENHSYKQFKDHPDVPTFDEQIQEAIQEPNWKRSSWDAFVVASSNQIVAEEDTFLVTGRGHAPRSILSGITNNFPEIKYAMKERNIWPVKFEHFIEFFYKRFGYYPPAEVGINISLRKLVVIKAILDEFEATPLPKMPQSVSVLTPDMKEMRPMHLLGFSDDDIKTFETVRLDLGHELAKNRWPNVKITLYFTTEKSQKSIVLIPNGGHRLSFEGQKEYLSILGNCSKYLFL
ncbi:MAG: hypothetical protein JNM93_14275 [Bacteriovoracaceae bacterium]|nr:hypothetical protein [Bacteriovoracaceae bacterium]